MIDHLVYAGPDLATASMTIAELLGAAPSPGGQHPGRGTRNELLSLGGATYLEVIGPDPEQPTPDDGRPFGVDGLPSAGLVAWCARPHRPLDDIVAEARRAGVEFGAVAAMSRRRPDGVLLEWHLTFPQRNGPLGCALPFLIDWGESAHPTDALTIGVELVELRIVHPDPTMVRTALEIVGIEWVVVAAGPPQLAARIATGRGEVTLSS